MKFFKKLSFLLLLTACSNSQNDDYQRSNSDSLTSLEVIDAFLEVARNDEFTGDLDSFKIFESLQFPDYFIGQNFKSPQGCRLKNTTSLLLLESGNYCIVVADDNEINHFVNQAISAIISNLNNPVFQDYAIGNIDEEPWGAIDMGNDGDYLMFIPDSNNFNLEEVRFTLDGVFNSNFFKVPSSIHSFLYRFNVCFPENTQDNFEVFLFNSKQIKNNGVNNQEMVASYYMRLIISNRKISSVIISPLY